LWGGERYGVVTNVYSIPRALLNEQERQKRRDYQIILVNIQSPVREIKTSDTPDLAALQSL
jgi:hypothetical protein